MRLLKFSGSMLIAVGLLYLGVSIVAQQQAQRALSPYAHTDPRGGKITDVRTRYIWIATRYDPILALPFVDTNGLRSAVAALDESADVIAQHYEDEESLIIKESLYPITFLSTLPYVENERRAFLDNPTLQKARTYYARVHKSLVAYRKAVEAAREHLMRLPPDHKLGYIAGDSDLSFVDAQLASTLGDVDRALQVAKKRRLCLRSIVFCGDSILPAKTYTASIEEPTLSSLTVPEEAQDIRKALTEFLIQKPERALILNPSEELVPIVALASSHCMPASDPYFVARWETTSRVSNIPISLTTPIEDLWFHTATHSKDGRLSEFDQLLSDAGLIYTLQLFNPYLCIDAAHELGRINTLAALWEDIRSTPSFQGFQYGVLSDQVVKKIEAHILSEAIPYEETIEAYVAALTDLVASHPEEVIVNAMGIDTFMRIQERMVAWKTQSAGLETTLGTMEDLASTSDSLLRIRLMSLGDLFLTRTHPGIVFLLNNQTLLSSAPSLLRTRKPNELTKLRLTTYYSEVEEIVPIEELSEFLLNTAARETALTSTRLPKK